MGPNLPELPVITTGESLAYFFCNAREESKGDVAVTKYINSIPTFAY
jgi:hypothetical protein